MLQDLPRPSAPWPLAALFLVLSTAAAPVQEKAAEPAPGESAETVWPEASVTRHSILLDGQPFAYVAEAGTLALSEEQGDFRRELGYENDLAYEILTGRVHPWNYSNVEGRYLNVAETLRVAMAQNPSLQVFVANGFYDLATPYFATQYTFDHLSMDTEYSDRVTMTYFPAGHMTYIQKVSLAGLKAQLVAFYARALGR